MATSSAGDQHFAAHPSTKIGYVSLNVSDISQSLEFYESTLGFKVMGRQSAAGDRALLSPTGSNSTYLVELRKAARKEEMHRRRSAGLYHFAILLPERRFLADALVLLLQGEKRGRVRFDGMADHGVSESVYIRDPDSNGIEIYRDRPRPEWPPLQQQNGLVASADGSRQQIRMVTERLDMQSLLAQATDEGWKGMPAGITIGHVHLHVRDLGRALQFYSGALGLGLTFALPGAYFFAAGDYHHHVATNTWLGSDDNVAAAAQPGAKATELIGLNHFAIKIPDEKEVKKIAENVSRHGIIPVSQEHGAIMVRDPDGITVKLYCR